MADATASETTAAQVFIEVSERYNNSEMAEALKALARWHISTPETRAADRLAAKRAGAAAALRLNEQRRLVSCSYLDIARLAQFRTNYLASQSERPLGSADHGSQRGIFQK